MAVSEFAYSVFHDPNSGTRRVLTRHLWSLTVGTGVNSKNQENVNWLSNYEPAKRPIKILFYGPVGAGKSSFINSVQSALRNKIHNQRAVGAIGGESFTRGVRDGAAKQMLTMTNRKDRWKNLYKYIIYSIQLDVMK